MVEVVLPLKIQVLWPKISNLKTLKEAVPQAIVMLPQMLANRKQ